MVCLSDVDFKIGIIKWLCESLEEDMLQVEYPNNFILDLGWYHDQYIIYIIKDYEWSVPVVKYSIKNESNLLDTLQMAIDRIILDSQNAKAYYGK